MPDYPRPARLSGSTILFVAMTGSRIGTSNEAWAAADALAQNLVAGDDLLDIESTGLPLGCGEVLHASIAATCSWYGEAEVTYQKQHVLMFGSTAWLGLTAAASAIGNRRRRNSALALATPQWRPLGDTHVLLTSERLAIPYEDSLMSIWLDDITEIVRHPDACHLEVVCQNDLALSMHGDWIPYLTVGLSHLLTERSTALV